MFGGNFAPRTWALCEGQLLAISSNTALFSIIGTTYGGVGLSDRRLGAKGGTENVTLNITQIPSHNHSAIAQPGTGPSSATVTVNAAATATTTDPTNALWAKDVVGPVYGVDAATTMASNAVEISNVQAPLPNVTIGNTGGSQSHHNMQPWIAVNFIICMQGIFPSRS